MSFLNTIRVDAWWVFKIGPVLAFAFAEVTLHTVPPDRALILVTSLMISAFGIAGFGHLVNDAFDAASDARAGKRNALSRRTPTQRGVLTLAHLAVGFVPWAFVPAPRSALVILAANALLLVAYAAPPFRLKERGAAGVIADAAYAHVLPVLFVLTVFDGASIPSAPADAWLAGAIGWALCFGIRGILLHQVWDFENDRRAGVRTFVTDRGPDVARRLVHRITYPGELLFLGVLGVVLLARISVAFWILIGYAACWWIGRGLGVYPRTVSLDPLPMVAGTHVPLAPFYSLWPAIAVAVALLVEDVAYAVLLAGLVVLFPGAVGREVVRSAHLVRGIGHQGYWAIRNTVHALRSRSRTAESRVPMNAAQLPGAGKRERDS